jgi:hypothetical protein
LLKGKAMASLYDLPHFSRLAADDAAPETDLIPVYHPSGGLNTDRSISLAKLVEVAGGGGEPAPGGGVSQADFDELKANVIADLNNLRDAIMYTQASLDADTGVATDTFALNGTPPPLLTV